MSTQPKVELSYAVVIYRKDEQHIIALRETDYDKAYKLWEELQHKWISAHKETQPFILKDPEVTCFEPGLIKEIKIEPIAGAPVGQGMEHNPYMKRMQQTGFGATQGQGVKTGMDLLDNGYTR